MTIVAGKVATSTLKLIKLTIKELVWSRNQKNAKITQAKIHGVSAKRASSNARSSRTLA